VTSRRNFLRLAGTVVIGLGAVLVTNGLVTTESVNKDAGDLAGAMIGSNTITKTRASLITVKVYYSMMSQYIDLTEENFVLQSPTTLQNLIDTCVVRHPSISKMVGTMLVLLNGVPSKPTAPLRDGDTIQFIPVSSGG
jgi:molybdopterin converting factor small subunit